MPKLGPIKRKDFIHYMRELGFQGPFAGGNHQFMMRGTTRVPIPNPHQGDISIGLLRRVLSVAGITDAEWENL